MPDYSKGKIYKIVSPNTEEVYIGSTTQKLSNRMTSHRKDYRNGKYMTSSEIIKHGDAKIVLVENYPCETKEQLEKREQECMDECNSVNIQRPANKFNPDTYYKEYYIKNRDKKRRKVKEWALKNPEKIKARNRKKYTCECGSVFTMPQKARHYRTEKHSERMKEIDIAFH